MSLSEERKLQYIEEKHNKDNGVLNGLPLF